MKNIKKALACAAAVGTATLAAATPEVSNVTMAQASSSRLVTITYELSEDAVVTLDVLTNATPNAATGWASIGGKAICNAEGAVWRKVTSMDADGSGKYTITWRPDLSWLDESGNGFKVGNGCAKAVVTAWSLDNTPNYMVVDVSAAAQQNTQKYYPAADFVPGSVTNGLYKTTTLLMRKIMAKNVQWTMGSTALEGQRQPNETTHQVTLTNNYYIGVYPITQEQWSLIQPNRATPSRYKNVAERAMRPVETVCYNEIRMAANATAAASGAKEWPDPPYEGSFLDLLHTKTGIAFDLPSEAQWEFAARAGNGDTKWGNGSGILNIDEDTNLPGRYRENGGKIKNGSSWVDPDASCGTTNGTAIVGSYAPNAWGLYDTAGNVSEWCLDWHTSDITELNGVANTTQGTSRVVRGGGWGVTARYCRPAQRSSAGPDQRYSDQGFRVVCTAGLQ